MLPGGATAAAATIDVVGCGRPPGATAGEGIRTYSGTGLGVNGIVSLGEDAAAATIDVVGCGRPPGATAVEGIDTYPDAGLGMLGIESLEEDTVVLLGEPRPTELSRLTSVLRAREGLGMGMTGGDCSAGECMRDLKGG
jgi:hypothetical protein